SDGPDAQAWIVVLEAVARFVHGARHLQDAFDPFLTPPLGALMSGADPVRQHVHRCGHIDDLLVVVLSHFRGPLTGCNLGKTGALAPRQVFFWCLRGVRMPRREAGGSLQCQGTKHPLRPWTSSHSGFPRPGLL